MPASLESWEPVLQEVAARLIKRGQAIASDIPFEHIGSSAVPGLAGKGFVDLLAAATPARIPSLVAALVASGWQRQREEWAFPATRPMLQACVKLRDRVFHAHLHVLPAGDPEIAELLGFRDALRASPELCGRYIACKRRVLDAGITHGPDYAEAKSEFIKDALCQLGLGNSARNTFAQSADGSG